LAFTAIPLLAGAAESGLLSTHNVSPAGPLPTVTLIEPAANSHVTFEGSLVLTESPATDEFVTQSVKRSKQRTRRNKTTTESIATGRSGLTKFKQPTLLTLFPGEDASFGDPSVFPAIPGTTKTSRIRLSPSGTYRTLCVRLCDGYYWPVSFSTSRDGIAEDKDTCESSCGVPVKLFYYQNPDGSPEEAVDLKGQRYASLANAFRYRNEYVDSCKCQPDPWEAAALERHQTYAELVKAGKLALYDNRKPKKGRKRQILVGFDGPTVTTLVDPQSGDIYSTDPAPKTTVTTVKGQKRKATLSIKKRGSEQSKIGTAMGITKIGQSASGKNYSAKKKSGGASAFVSRK
jgi:hypothetical protein